MRALNNVMNKTTTPLRKSPFEAPHMDADVMYLQLWEWYRPILLAYATSVIGQEAPAEEIVNDVLVTLWSRLHEVIGMNNPERWLLACVRNAAITKSQKIKKRNLVSLKEHAFEIDVAGTGDLPGYLKANVRAAIDRLRPRQREVMLLGMDGYSRREIAALLGIKYGTVKNHVTQSIKQLRVLLAS